MMRVEDELQAFEDEQNRQAVVPLLVQILPIGAAWILGCYVLPTLLWVFSVAAVSALLIVSGPPEDE